MPFEIIWSEPALKELRKIDRTIAKRIFDGVSELREEPYRKVIRLVNSPYFRMRIGDYRIILDIQGDRMRVLVLKLGHRKNAYRR